MNRENNGRFSISSSIDLEVKRELYNNTKDVQIRAREIFRLRNDEWYKTLVELFKVHNLERAGETFLPPEDCPNNVWEQFCEDMIKGARAQGIHAAQEAVLDEKVFSPPNYIELVDEDSAAPVELDNEPKEINLNTILIGKEAREEALIQIRNSQEYKILLEQYQSGKTSVDDFAEAVRILSSDTDPFSKATRVLFYDIKIGLVHPPDIKTYFKKEIKDDVNIQNGKGEDGVIFKFSKRGVTAKPSVKRQVKKVLDKDDRPANVELVDDKKEAIAETLYNPEELKATVDWLNEKVTLGQEKNYADLRGKEREAADQRLLDNTKDIWQYFVKSEKWFIGKEENKVNIEDKGDIDAKITLGMLKQAGLEEKIYKYIEQLTRVESHDEANKETSWSGLEIGEGGLARFDQGLSFPNQKACAAEVMCKLLVAGGVYKEDDEAPRIAAELAHRAVYNDLLTNKNEFINSDKTARGLARFFDYGNLFAYLRNNWPKIKSKTWAESFKNLLDRSLDQKDLEHYFVKKDDRGKNIIDYQKEQTSIIEQAKVILEKSDAELKTEGRIVESPIWGKIFINVMNSAKDGFPGGASSVGAYGVADAYLNIDLKENSFLFRPFGELTKEQKAKLNLPGGSWAYSMYLKTRGDKSSPISKEEIFKQLEVEVVPVAPTIEHAPVVEIESTPATESVSEAPEQDEEIEKKVKARRINIEQVWQRKTTEPKYADYLNTLTREERIQWIEKLVAATLELYRKQLYDTKTKK